MNPPGYKIDRVLGRGATAQVFAATRESDGRAVALKVFHPGLWDQADLRRRAMGEFKTVSSLDHPNILRVIEPHWDAESPAVALELIDGTSLEEFQSRLPYILPEVAVLVLVDVLSALEYAHSRGVIHRDLKPANILISREGRVVVSDFGLAKMRDVSRLTLSGTVLGSPDYMSPEQARGDLTTERSDLFAAAAILYFLVTGTRPFSRRTPLATLAAVSEASAEPASRRNPKLSPGLARILAKGLAKEVDDRYESAADFKAALQVYLLGLGLESSQFALPLWIQSPTDTSLEALKTITDALIVRAEKQLASSHYDETLETLSHLGQVAPESAALPRLMDQLDRKRSEARRRALILTSARAGGVFFILLVGGVWASKNLRHLNFGPPEVVSVSAPKAPAAASTTGAPTENPASSPAQTQPAVATTTAAPERVQATATSTQERPIRTSRAAPTSAQVRFDVPDDVAVFWDGRRVDPLKPLPVAKLGDHQLLLSRPGSRPIRETVHVQLGEPTIIKVK